MVKESNRDLKKILSHNTVIDDSFVAVSDTLLSQATSLTNCLKRTTKLDKQRHLKIVLNVQKSLDNISKPQHQSSTTHQKLANVQQQLGELSKCQCLVSTHQ